MGGARHDALVLAGAGGCEQVLAGAGRIWQVSAGADRYWQELAGGGYCQVLVGAGTGVINCPQVLDLLAGASHSCTAQNAMSAIHSTHARHGVR